MNSTEKVCGSALSEAFGLIGLIYIERRSIWHEEDDHQKKEEVAGRIPEKSLEPIQSRYGESQTNHDLSYFDYILFVGIVFKFFDSIIIYNNYSTFV